MDRPNEKPKAAPFAGIVLFGVALVFIVGLLTFAGPCDVPSGAEASSCFWAFRAMLGMGVVLAIISAVRIFETDEGERRGLSFSAALIGALIAITPGVLIDLCANPAAHCQSIMRPFALVLGIAVAIVGGVDLVRRLLAIGKTDSAGKPENDSKSPPI